MLQYSDGSTPSNLSLFAFYEQNPLSQDGIQSDALYLTLVNQLGTGQTLSEISKAAKQIVYLPKNFHELSNQMNYGKAAFEIVTGDDSHLSSQLDLFARDLNKIKQKIKARFASDKMFGAKILFAVDGKIQNYLENCRMAEDRSEVDDSILNFEEITRDISNNRFFIDLPPSFTAVEKVDPPPSNEKKKGKRKRGDDSNRVVRNPDPIDGICLRAGEDFGKIFAGKLIDQRPKWGNKKMCTRWHLRHVCFEDCVHKASHVPKDKVSEEKAKEMKEYVGKVRALN